MIKIKCKCYPGKEDKLVEFFNEFVMFHTVQFSAFLLSFSHQIIVCLLFLNPSLTGDHDENGFCV